MKEIILFFIFFAVFGLLMIDDVSSTIKGYWNLTSGTLFPEDKNYNVTIGADCLTNGIELKTTGDICMSGDLTMFGSTFLINGTSINGSQIPALNNKFTIGNSSNQWYYGWFNNLKSNTEKINLVGDLNVTANASIGNTLFVNASSGKVGIGISTPAANLDIRDGKLVLSDVDVAHSVTDYEATNTYGSLSPLYSAAGGLKIQAISEGDQIGLYFYGIIGTNNPTDTIPATVIDGYKRSGTGVSALGAAETVLQLRNGGENLVTLLGNGNVGIRTTVPNFPLTVAINNTANNISIWAGGNISATGYITRTSAFDSSKNAWDYIKDSSYYKTNGKIDPSKFYGYASYSNIDYSRPVNIEKLSEYNKTIIVTTYPYKIKEEGVMLDKEIDLLRQGLYELKQENDLLKSELCKKDISYAWCK